MNIQARIAMTRLLFLILIALAVITLCSDDAPPRPADEAGIMSYGGT
jgi:hypothetical protein